MYQKICKYCDELITVDKQQHFASHVASCLSNPKLGERKKNYTLNRKGKLLVERITIDKICPKCGDTFFVTDTESNFNKNKTKNYCSRQCANSRIFTQETLIKMSESAKNSDNIKLQSKLSGEKRRSKPPEYYLLKTSNKRKNKPSKKEITKTGSVKKFNVKISQFICKYCGESGEDHKYNPDRKYHKDCWLKVSGGIKPGSSRGKCGWYKGYWCDSSYELAFIIYCLDHNIQIERNTQGFEYTYKEKKSLFYPDFIVEGQYTEIKNYRSELTDCKINQFPYKINIYYTDTMKPYLDYTINKYGKKFVDLYENNL